MLIIFPDPLLIICLATTWLTLKTDEIFVFNNCSNISGGKSSSGVRCCIPALFTNISIEPISFSNLLITLSISFLSVTSKDN